MQIIAKQLKAQTKNHHYKKILKKFNFHQFYQLKINLNKKRDLDHKVRKVENLEIYH